MGDHDHGLACGKLRKRFLHLCLIVRVGKGGSLIQNQDRRIFQHGPGNGQTLCLTAGHISALTSDHSIHTIRQLCNDILTLGIFQCFHDFLSGGILFAHADIVIYGHFQKLTVLKYEGHHIHQLYRRNLLHIHTADADLSFRGIVKAGDQAGQSGLTATGRAYESHMLPFFYIEIDLMQSISSRIFIAEGYIL